jgi:hypothetical protein
MLGKTTNLGTLLKPILLAAILMMLFTSCAFSRGGFSSAGYGGFAFSLSRERGSRTLLAKQGESLSIGASRSRQGLRHVNRQLNDQDRRGNWSMW